MAFLAQGQGMPLLLAVVSFYLSTEVMQQHNNIFPWWSSQEGTGNIVPLWEISWQTLEGEHEVVFSPPLLQVQQARRNSAGGRHKLSFSSPLADRAGFCKHRSHLCANGPRHRRSLCPKRNFMSCHFSVCLLAPFNRNYIKLLTLRQNLV